MLKTLLDVTIPILVFLLMLVVGMELVPDDLRRAARQFRSVGIATVAQIILWPLVAVSVILTLRLKPYIATGILLVAVCPCGGMANFYVYLGRANLPLSVTLTAVSCLSAVVTMPLLMALLRTHLVEFSGLEAPISLMIGQLLLLLILPILLGMLSRRVRPCFTKRHGRTILRLGIAALAGLIAIVIAQEYEQLVVDFTDISLAVAVLTVIMLAAAWVVGWASNFGAGDRFTLAMVLVVRNVGIATAVAVTVLGRIEFAAFPTAYFVNQVPIICAALILFRLRRPQEKVSTRRMNFDERMYEQANTNTPSVEDLREKARVESLRRSLNNPPTNEIMSGDALNTILEAIQKDLFPVSLRPIVPLDAQTLSHINTSAGSTSGSIGLLRDGGELTWPLPLMGRDFADNRAKIQQLGTKALSEAGQGSVDAETLQAMTSTANNLRDDLKQKVDDFSIGDYMAAIRY